MLHPRGNSDLFTKKQCIIVDEYLHVKLPDEVILEKIYVIRGMKVMLDKDLAHLYDVETKVLKQAVRRNIDRFPDDFMFELSNEEFKDLRSQIVTSSWGGARYVPMVFTEQGVAMLSSVLNSKQAIQVNIQIIRVFTKMRELILTKKDLLIKMEHLEMKMIKQDEKIALVFKYLKEFIDCQEKTNKKEIDFRQRKRIGFKPNKK